MSPVDVPFRIDGAADAPVLLLSNSLGTTSEMWDPQVPALAERFRVIRYDTRGHGSAPVPDGPYSLDDVGGDALALLDRLGVEQAHVAGVSLGGMTAMWLGINAPERIGRLALICTSAMLAEEHDWPARAALVREQGTSAVAEASMTRWFTPAFIEANPDLVAGMKATIMDTPPEGYAACCEVIAGMDIVEPIGAITAPTLVISGRADPATPPAHGERIAARIPGARFELVEAAHLANIEQADEVTGLLLSHLEGAMTDDERREQGMAVRRAVLGDAHVDRASTNATELTADFQDYLTRAAWGDVWSRPGLDRRTRSMITLAALTAARAEGEIEIHVRGAINNGLTPADIAEVLLHTAVYAGVPASNAAFAIAQRTLAEMGLPEAVPPREA